MRGNHQTQRVHVNKRYIRQYLKDHNLQATKISEAIGKSKTYLSGTVYQADEIDMTVMLLLCHVTGMDFDEATKREVPVEPTPKTVSEGSAVTQDALKELTELIITYIQDLGKIHSDVLRELRETKAMFKEYIDKHGREFHELDVYLRNSGAEARKSREAMNNTLGKTHNYLERKLEQQTVK